MKEVYIHVSPTLRVHSVLKQFMVVGLEVGNFNGSFRKVKLFCVVRSSSSDLVHKRIRSCRSENWRPRISVGESRLIISWEYIVTIEKAVN